MDIHKPKPFSNWREFLSEIVVIVCGVVIAPALEQAVEQIHEHVTADEARQEILAEIAQDRGFMESRAQTQDCLARRLDEIAALLDKAGTGVVTPQPSWIGEPSDWVMATQRWQAATSAGRTSLLGHDEQLGIADFYALAGDFTAAEDREQDAWAQLRALETWRGPLGEAGRVHFVTALQQARYEFYNIRADLIIARRLADHLGVRSKQARAFAARRVPHAVCLPITTSREDALRQLGDDEGFGQPK